MSATLSALLFAAALAAPAPAPAPAPPAIPVVTVHASEFAFVSPPSIRSGTTTFRLVNDGRQLHHLSIVKLAAGKTMADFMSALKAGGPPPMWATDVGGPNAPVPGGGTSEATLTLESGSYILACWIPSPGEMTPHAMKGMVHALTVTGTPNGAVEPKADVQVRLSDYNFDGPATLAPGRHVIRVTNDARQTHEMLVVALAPGKTAKEMADWVLAGQKGPPPGKPLGGAVGLAKGRSQTFPLTLEPGSYGLLCFVPDMKDGKEHVRHGMVKDIQVSAK